MLQEILPGMAPTSATLREIVIRRLVGFRERQREREEIRRKKREARREPNMKSPIVFRAVFRQPKGGLNPSGLKMSAPIEVELYHSKIDPPEWRARSLPSRIDFRQICGQREFTTLEQQIELHFFVEKLSPWEAYDVRTGCGLNSDEWAIDQQGKPHLTEIFHANQKNRSEAIRESRKANAR